jgi:NAD dependent epimerase/dehydratase
MELRNRRVLVTGSCGFIGSHLVERLLKEGCRVKAFVFYNSFNSWGWLDTFEREKLRKIEVLAGDIRDANGIKTVMRDTDIVFNLAALVSIPFSYYAPDSYVDTNIKGTLNVLQACRECDVKKVVITSTSESYGTAKYVPIDENHPLRGQSPYAATKIGADKITESFYRSFNMPIVIARPFNTYGPRQSARAVIPTIICQALSDSKTIRLGNLAPTRDFTYVEDTCEGFIALARSDTTIGTVTNICSSQEISIGDLAKRILSLMKTKKAIATDPDRIRPNNSEVERLFGDNKLINSLTNWKPRHSLDMGLKKTIEWFSNKKNLSYFKPEIYNI